MTGEQPPKDPIDDLVDQAVEDLVTDDEQAVTPLCDYPGQVMVHILREAGLIPWPEPS